MSTKHTPGPWRVNYTKFSQVLNEDGFLVATCAPVGALATLQANARVVAAAPATLAIVKRLAAIAEALDHGSSAAEAELSRLVEVSRAVVAEAEA